MASTTRHLIVGLLILFLIPSDALAQLTPQQERGRSLYFGEDGSALEDATARIGEMGVKLPARSFPCASCHGRSGTGVAERGAVPTDLSAGALTKPSSVAGPRGRKRPAYTFSTFRTAVRSGKDAGDTPLSNAMPRFDLADRDLRDLWAFLEVMDQVREPGVSDQEVLIGVRLKGASQAPEAIAQRRLLGVMEQDITAMGGIHGRKLRFVYAGPGGAYPEDIFAGIDLGALPATAPQGLPVVTMMEQKGQSQLSFSLVAGVDDQSAALRLFAVRELGAVNVQDACQKGARSETRLLTSPDCLKDLAGVRTLLMPQPVLAALSPATRSKLPENTYVALPAPLGRTSPQVQALFARTRSVAGNSRATVLAEADAYSAAALVIEGLMRAGRDLYRDQLVSTLQDITDFKGAMAPPATFGPNKHTGSRGAEIVRYDPARGILASTGVWVEPQDK